ncbi:MAG: hypothetical protein ATN36_02380 [Epulopiscium sp. Nele67-Bin005]|nr:MAG: hypothetical protein ATN36_02380 [Epulopiscium sp. Nele67-Bin005]
MSERAKALGILQYNKVSGDLSEMLDMKCYMRDKLFEDEALCSRVVKADDVASLQKMSSKAILAGRKKQDFTKQEEKGIPEDWLRKYFQMEFIEQEFCTQVKFDMMLEADYFFRGYRTTKISIKNMKIEPQTLFEVKNSTNMYATEKFSLGFSWQDEKYFGFSIGVMPATTGVKGEAQCIITCLTDESYIVDDGAKYFDVSHLIKNMSV